MYKIELINKKTNEITTFDTLVDKNEGEKMFFKFEINTSLLTDGEYTLKLYDDDELIKTETVTVGDYDTKALQYKKGENIYVETILTTNLSDKSVSITETNTTIYPDKGFDGFTSLSVDANNVYDRGVNDGIEEQKNKLTSITITENDIYSNEDGYNEVIVDVQPNLQEKYVSVTDNNTTVTADEEFDGMSKVTVNASPVYNNGYNVGKSDGIEEQKSKLTSITINDNGTYTNEDGYNEVIVDVKVKSYSYLTNTVDEDGLRQLGWNSDDVNYLKDNNLHYEWENDSYNVTPENIVLKERIKNLNDLKNLKTDLNFIYAPYIDANGVSEGENLFSDAKNLKAIPLYNFRIFRANSMFSSCKNLTTIPPLDTSKATDMNNMFNKCNNLTYIPPLDTSNVTNMSYMFYTCISLTNIPLFDTSNVTNMNSMFNGCTILTTIPPFDTSNVNNMNSIFSNCTNLRYIPLLDTSNVTNMSYMFSNCTNLTTIPPFDTSNVSVMNSMFSSCNNLTYIPLLDTSNVTNINTFMGYSEIKTLTDLGGFKNLKIDWNDGYGLAKCPNLTKQSVLNVINYLYDFRGNGDSTTTRTIKFHKNSLALLSDDEKAIATNKGWVLTS